LELEELGFAVLALEVLDDSELPPEEVLPVELGAAESADDFVSPAPSLLLSDLFSVEEPTLLPSELLAGGFFAPDFA
jgi:hypothetical protein